MNNQNNDAQIGEAAKTGVRNYDAPNPQALAEFMASGWAPSPLEGIAPHEVCDFTAARRRELSKKYPGYRLVIPSGGLKVRSNDTDFPFRPHAAFAYFTGIVAEDALPDSILVLEPNNNSTGLAHDAYLFVHPRQSRETDQFYRNSRHGEFWIGRRMTVEETEIKYGIATKPLSEFASFVKEDREAIILRGEDADCDALFEVRKKKEEEIAIALSEMRLIKDSYEIQQLQHAIDATIRGFADMVRALPAATSRTRGERVLEAAFFGRARLEGNDLGYNSIIASGSHACILHWTKNDGDVLPGDLVLIDAGVEADSYYTADVTRTLPINGKFTTEQRNIYNLVYEAQKAGFEACKPGNKFSDVNKAAQAVLAKGLYELGVLPVTPEESLTPDSGLHKRWSVHGTSHMLGIDVHDCAEARNENYRDGIIQEGMVFTVEPGLYIHADDLLFPAEYRGIGVRIEDDVLITADGCTVLSRELPSHPDEVEVWMSNLLR
jgi:Xaa-Pro aminopeptidase